MLTGVILAGGQNRRMGGKHKALIPINGIPLLRLQLERMTNLCSHILIVTNTPALFEPIINEFHLAEVRCIPDILPGNGPLSGIHAACQTAVTDRLWVVGCDMPFISVAAARELNSLCDKTHADAAIPVIDGKVQPLHGIYEKRIESTVEDLLEKKQFKLLGLLERIQLQTADDAFFTSKKIALTFTVNLNTPEEFQAAVDLVVE